MPLSSQERARLAQIEAALRADPDCRLGDHPDDVPRRRVRSTLAVAVMVIGLALGLAGAAMAPHSFAVGLIVIVVGCIGVVGGAVEWFTAGHRPGG